MIDLRPAHDRVETQLARNEKPEKGLQGLYSRQREKLWHWVQEAAGFEYVRRVVFYGLTVWNYYALKAVALKARNFYLSHHSEYQTKENALVQKVASGHLNQDTVEGLGREFCRRMDVGSKSLDDEDLDDTALELTVGFKKALKRLEDRIDKSKMPDVAYSLYCQIEKELALHFAHDPNNKNLRVVLESLFHVIKKDVDPQLKAHKKAFFRLLHNVHEIDLDHFSSSMGTAMEKYGLDYLGPYERVILTHVAYMARRSLTKDAAVLDKSYHTVSLFSGVAFEQPSQHDPELLQRQVADQMLHARPSGMVSKKISTTGFGQVMSTSYVDGRFYFQKVMDLDKRRSVVKLKIVDARGQKSKTIKVPRCKAGQSYHITPQAIYLTDLNAKTIKVYNLNGRKINEIDLPGGDDISYIVPFKNPESSEIAIVTKTSRVIIYNLDTGVQRTIAKPQGALFKIDRLISNGKGYTCLFTNSELTLVEDGTTNTHGIKIMVDRKPGENALDYAQKFFQIIGDKLYTVDSKDFIRVWDLSDPDQIFNAAQNIKTLERCRESPISAFHVLENGVIVTGSRDGVLRFWDPDNDGRCTRSEDLGHGRICFVHGKDGQIQVLAEDGHLVMLNY